MTKPTQEQIECTYSRLKCGVPYEKGDKDVILAALTAYRQSQEVDVSELKKAQLSNDPFSYEAVWNSCIDYLKELGYLRQPQEQEVSEVHNPELTKLLQSPSVIERDNSKALEALNELSKFIHEEGVMSCHFAGLLIHIRNYVEGK